MKYRDLYQAALIFFALLVVAGIGLFVYRELFPQYKVYQRAYKKVERFRASLTGAPPAPFKMGIKQILIPDPENGPEIIDRCTSCHVALDLPHFSPTRVALDVNDAPRFDTQGDPILEPNPDYVWGILDKKIDAFRLLGDEQEAEKLARLKMVEVEGKQVDLTRVLQMHPLIDGETRPFQFHPMDTYGCTSCHSGNGRALVANRAHGPLYDGDYEKAFETAKPQFLEVDEEHDPKFAQMYNDKPGHELSFQTTPLLAGPLIEAKCAQCHQSSSAQMGEILEKIELFGQQKGEEIDRVEKGVEHDKQALITLLNLHRSIQQKGLEATVEEVEKELGNYRLPSSEIDALEGQLAYLKRKGPLEEDVKRLGGESLLEKAGKAQSRAEILTMVETLKRETRKEGVVVEGRRALARLDEAKTPLSLTRENKAFMRQMRGSVDRLLTSYGRGKELYISQACYACHRIAGFSRSSVGPDLTRIGLSYPWYVKESIVWPQADLPSSTMPNFRLDHEEVADLMAFLMAQRGDSKAISEVDYQISLKQWEAGAKMPWEEPLPPTEIQSIRTGMEVYATEGCAACHKLEGVESSIALEGDPEWFYTLFPEQISGKRLVQVLGEKGEEIDKRIVDTGKEGFLDTLDPKLVAGFYPSFKFASRAVEDQDRLRRVLMVYIQEYGLGRDIAPPLNWSGVYRDDAWLMGHFANPSAYTAKSIMPVMPFDESKFYTLNTMLHALGQKNRDKVRLIWKEEGFDPALAYQLLCSACHGENRQGNGIISEWIYPVPKNLRNPVFLSQLTKERAIDSIVHGVKGTPMPPWGESVLPDRVPVLTRSEIVQLVDWLYQGLPQAVPHQEEEKWDYTPEDVVEEMEKEGGLLEPIPPLAEEESVKELAKTYFEARPNPIPSPDKELFYIRQEFYTPQNLAAGEAFYQLNCAVCHGKEGTGAGQRAGTMVEAKPRMFTNLPWIRSRDDLRLLRSIKFGVSGTAMVAWGDQTTAEQRMQLTMYIRHFTESLLLRQDLQDHLYDAFDKAEIVITEARIGEYKALEKVQAAYEVAFEKRQELDDPEKGAEVYREELQAKLELEKRKELDSHYVSLIALVKEEKEIYENLGGALIVKRLDNEVVRLFFELIERQPLVYSLVEGKLTETQREGGDFLEVLLKRLDQEIATYQAQIDMLENQPISKDRLEKLQDVMDEQGSLINLRSRLVMGLANASQLREKQLQTLSKLQR